MAKPTKTTRAKAPRKMAKPAPAVPGIPYPFRGMAPTPPAANAAAAAAHSVDALFGRLGYAAGPAPSRYSTYPADGISAEIISTAFRQADLGYPRIQAELYEQVIERDAHLRGISRARIYEVTGKPWRIRPANESPLADCVAKFCRAVVEEIDSFDADIEDLLYAEAAAYSASEIVWHFNDIRFPTLDESWARARFMVPRCLEWVHGKHFEFDQITDEPYLWISGARIQLPANKFVFHAASGQGVIERRGYMRPCVPLHAGKAWAFRDWLLYEGLFAVPQITGSYPSDAEEYEKNRDAYKAMLRQWGKGIPAVVPDEFKMTITQATGGGTSAGIHAAIVGYVNQEYSKLITGSTLTVEIGATGSYAASETHADVRHAFVRADARRLERTLRSDLLRPIVELNVEELAAQLGANPDDILRAVPHFYWRIDRETTPKERCEIAISLANAGLPIDEEQLLDEFGFDKPRPGGKALEGTPVAVANGAAAVGSYVAADFGVKVDKQSDAAPTEGEPALTKPADAEGDETAKTTPIELTPTAIAAIVTVNEARASQGLPPLPGEDGLLTVAEFTAKHAQTVSVGAAATEGDAHQSPTDPAQK